MPGGAQAPSAGKQLEEKVALLAGELGLLVDSQVKAARRIWGAERRIDLVVSREETRQRLGIECKAQTSSGSAEEKIMATIKDIESWPIDGIVVIEGEGFSQNILGYLYSTGKVIHFNDLDEWLRLYFGLPKKK